MLKFIKAVVRHSLGVTCSWLGNNTAHFYGVLVSSPNDRT